MDEVKLCKISNSSKAVNEAYRVCIDEFSLCRKYEDASVKIILPCSQDPGQLKLQVTLASKVCVWSQGSLIKSNHLLVKNKHPNFERSTFSKYLTTLS